MSLPSIFDYLPEQAAALCKIAEEKREHPVKSVAKTVGTGLLGFGAGTLAGYGAGALADKIHESTTGRRIPAGFVRKAAPFVGGAMGLAYNLWKAKELEELRHAVNRPNRSEGSVPSK